MMHELPLERRTLHGHYSRELLPIVSVDPGDTIAFSCPNAGWEYERRLAARSSSAWTASFPVRGA